MSDFDLAIQFIVCPQRDFINRIDSDDVRPNRLHVGSRSSLKIRGDGRPGAPDPFVETTLRFYDPGLARRTWVVIDEDWHPKNCKEFPIFGEHCVKGTDGAKLAGRLEDLRWHERTRVIRANSINIASDKKYEEVLAEITAGVLPDRTRVGVYGVWTNVKVEYLLVNLRTLSPGFDQVAVCEPLCAAPDPSWHDRAIEKFEMMGYTVFREIPSYLEWMGINS